MTLHAKNHPISTIKKAVPVKYSQKRSTLPQSLLIHGELNPSSNKSIDNLRCIRRTNHQLGFGISCIECSLDNSLYCIPFHVQDIYAVSSNDSVDLVCESNCHDMYDTNTCSTPQPLDDNECPPS